MSNDDIKSLSFESASKELQLIINKIESGDVSLEDLSASVKRGKLLHAHCEKLLLEIKKEIQDSE